MPFCPRCGDEFETRVIECPDCHVKLTAQKRRVLKIRSVPLKLATVAVYDYAEQAQLNRIKLESAGIRVWVTDQNTMSANWFLNTALGGIKLQVDQSQAEEAARILESTRNLKQIPREYSGPLCPNCGSGDVHFELFTTRWVFLSILLVQLPLPFLLKKWRCNGCGQIWKEKPE